MIILNTKELKIKNLSAMPGGLMASYLLCLVGHDGDLIAKQWKKVIPDILEDGYVLVAMTKTASKLAKTKLGNFSS